MVGGAAPDCLTVRRPGQTEPMASFWVHENWRTSHRAMVHRAECPSCQNGRGLHGAPTNRHGQWLPADTFGEAERIAAASGAEVRLCSNCLRGAHLPLRRRDARASE